MFRALSTVSRRVNCRYFSIFTGAEQNVYLAGKANRVAADGAKSEVDVAVSFAVKPQLNLVYAQTFIAGSPNFEPQQLDEVYLLNKDGTAAQIKTITVDDVITAGNAKYTGPAFKWTAAQASVSLVGGGKRDVEFTFKSDSSVPFTATLTGADGKVISKETAELKVVPEKQFNEVEGKITKELVQVEEAIIQEEMAKARPDYQ